MIAAAIPTYIGHSAKEGFRFSNKKETEGARRLHHHRSSDADSIESKVTIISEHNISADAATASPASRLGNDLLGHVMSFLDAKDLARSGGVQKNWQFVSKQHFLWRKLCETDIMPFVSFPPGPFSFGHRLVQLGLVQTVRQVLEAACTTYATYLTNSNANYANGAKLLHLIQNAPKWQTALKEKYPGLSEAQFFDCLRGIVKACAGVTEDTQMVVLELTKPENTWAAMIDSLREVSKELDGKAFLLHTDPNHPAASKLPVENWKETRRWSSASKSETASIFKISRRKRDVLTGIGSVVLTNYLACLRTSPYLGKKKKTLIVYVHEHATKGPLPLWVRCLTGVPIVVI